MKIVKEYIMLNLLTAIGSVGTAERWLTIGMNRDSYLGRSEPTKGCNANNEVDDYVG